jgi:hypothetical protein
LVCNGCRQWCGGGCLECAILEGVGGKEGCGANEACLAGLDWNLGVPSSLSLSLELIGLTSVSLLALLAFSSPPHKSSPLIPLTPPTIRTVGYLYNCTLYLVPPPVLIMFVMSLPRPRPVNATYTVTYKPFHDLDVCSGLRLFVLAKKEKKSLKNRQFLFYCISICICSDDM